MRRTNTNKSKSRNTLEHYILTDNFNEVCNHKITYPNRKEAKGAARVATVKYAVDMTYYKCPHCGKYHVKTVKK